MQPCTHNTDHGVMLGDAVFTSAATAWYSEVCMNCAACRRVVLRAGHPPETQAWTYPADMKPLVDILRERNDESA